MSIFTFLKISQDIHFSRYLKISDSAAGWDEPLDMPFNTPDKSPDIIGEPVKVSKAVKVHCIASSCVDLQILDLSADVDLL